MQGIGELSVHLCRPQVPRPPDGRICEPVRPASALKVRIARTAAPAAVAPMRLDMLPLAKSIGTGPVSVRPTPLPYTSSLAEACR